MGDGWVSPIKHFSYINQIRIYHLSHAMIW
jgi:hypothetical protein